MNSFLEANINLPEPKIARSFPAPTQKEPILSFGVPRNNRFPLIDKAFAETTDHVLLIACVDDMEGRGGLYAFDGTGLMQLDPLDTMSVVLHQQRLTRLLWSSPETDPQLLTYRPDGVDTCLLRGHWDAHQIVTWQSKLLLASTSHNGIFSLEEDAVIPMWSFPGQGDAWHLNCLSLVGERLYASAFGRFATHRGWKDTIERSGIVFDVQTGCDVLTGLSAPHHPRLIDGRWIVCNSAAYELISIDPQSHDDPITVPLGGWTRGLAETEKYIFVGVSAPRHEASLHACRAEVVILCRQSLHVVGRVQLAAREICDLYLVPSSLLRTLGA